LSKVRAKLPPNFFKAQETDLDKSDAGLHVATCGGKHQGGRSGLRHADRLVQVRLVTGQDSNHFLRIKQNKPQCSFCCSATRGNFDIKLTGIFQTVHFPAPRKKRFNISFHRCFRTKHGNVDNYD